MTALPFVFLGGNMKSVITWASYVLVHTPDMVIANGSTQTTERIVNPNSEYLQQLPKHIRSYESALSYPPNRCYIGDITPAQLGAMEQPYYENGIEDAERFSKFGEIMPEDEFYLLIQACDSFDLVFLEENFVKTTKEKLSKHPLMREDILNRIKNGVSKGEIERFINEEHAEGLYIKGEAVGFVKRAHDVDPNLSAHIMLENLVSKASSVLSLLHTIDKSGIDPSEIDYVIECSEEACGDMNQRGGGNFAKAEAEIAGLMGATGSDLRGFCAAPAHAMVTAASLVKAGTFKHVIVTAGGSTAKLGMNGKDHVKKGLPVLEDMVASFSILVSRDDGVNPYIDLDHVGRHTVGTGSSPQAVISSLVLHPLQSANLRIPDIDKYAAEMQNPEITKPAGAGDVPLANFKMIGALAVKEGQLERKELNSFIEKHGMQGWAPTQGHIPSGVPYVGFAREALLSGEIKNAMIVGKGSLFLGRLTNLFDGISFMMLPNEGLQEEKQFDDKKLRLMLADALRKFAQSLGGEGE